MYVKSLRGNLWNWRNKWHKTPTLCGAACWWCQQQNCNMLFLMQIQPLWCRSAPLFFRVSPLSLLLPLCVPQNSHWTLSLSSSHTHILFLPRGCVWLRHEINFRACTLPPRLWRPFSLTMKRDCCCASLRITPTTTTLMPLSCPRILQCSTLVPPGSLPSSSSPAVQSSCGALSFLLYVA